MSIKFIIECDSYKTETVEEFKARSERGCEMQATAYDNIWKKAKQKGWTRKRVEGKFRHYCPTCSEAMKGIDPNGQ